MHQHYQWKESKKQFIRSEMEKTNMIHNEISKLKGQKNDNRATLIA